MKLTRDNAESHYETIWIALENYHDQCISGCDNEWDDICTAMAWIKEDSTGERE